MSELDSSTIIAFFAVIISIISLIITYRHENRSFNSEFILKLAESFSKQEMNLALKEIKNSKDCTDDQIKEKLQDKSCSFDEQRRLVTHHFFKIYLLRKSGIINRKMLKIITQKENIELLKDAVKRIEEINGNIHSIEYNKHMFDWYEKLLKYGFYENSRIREFIAFHRSMW